MHYEQFADGTVKCIEDEIPFEVPESWEWTRLNTLGVFAGGKTPSTGNGDFWDGNVLWTTSKDMKSKYISDTIIKMSSLGAEQMQIFLPGTILMVVRSGILRRTFPVAILKKASTVNQDIKALTPYILDLCEYLYCFFKANEDGILLKCAKSGTTVESINIEYVKNLLVPLPSLTEQTRIINTVSTADSHTDMIESGESDLQSLIAQTKSKILDLAIRGKLVPQDPNDEPASALVERIRTEKEKLIKEGKIERDKKESFIFKGEDNSYYEKTGSKTVCIDDQLPLEIPDSWTWCRGYSCFMGMKTKKPEGEFFNYIDIDSIDNKQHIVNQPKHLATKAAPSRANRALQEGSVVFSLVRPYLENVAFIDVTLNDCIASTGFYICNSNGTYYPEFMFYLMISKYVIDGLNQFMKGDNSPSISKESIENWLYPVPPYNEQIAIVERLKSIKIQIMGIETSLT